MDVYWQPSLRVFLKPTGGDDKSYCLSIQQGKVVIADPSPVDLNQYWIKDTRYGAKAKDAEGQPAFSLINKGTGQALQHQGGGDDFTQPTKLIQYNTDKIDWSTLFTESSEPGSGYSTIRLQNYVNWPLYVQWGATKVGSEVRQGLAGHVTSALWKMVQQPEPSWRVFLKSSHIGYKSYCLSIRNGKVVVAQTDPLDKNQYWIRDNRFSSYVDAEGCPAFALFNKGTGEALQHAGGGDDYSQPTKLIKYNNLSGFSGSTLFTEAPYSGDGFRAIKLQNYVNWFLYIQWGSTTNENIVLQCVKDFAEAGQWKLEVVYDQPIPKTIYRVQCMETPFSSLGVRDHLPVMFPDDPYDDTQNWIIDARYNYQLDKDGMPGFVVINKGTNDILVHYKTGTDHHARLIPYEPTKFQDGCWWTESPTKASGFYNIRCLDYSDKVFTLRRSGKPDTDAIPVILTNEKNIKGTFWKITERGAMENYWRPSLRLFLKPTGGDIKSYCLSIQNGKVVIADPNPEDLNQYWIKDKTYSSTAKDAEGHPAFSLINKGTGQALQHAGGGDDYTQPTKLIQYNTNGIDWSTLFTESLEPGSGYAKIRLQNYVNWPLYVQWGATKVGSEVRQGLAGHVTSALWKMEQQQEPSWRLFLKSSRTGDKSYCLSIRNGKVVIAQTDPLDRNQYWIRDNRFSFKKDAEGRPSFALINKGTHEALLHAGGGDDNSQPTKLANYNILSGLNGGTLFTESPDAGDGFRVIRLQNYVNWFLYVKWGSTTDGSEVRQCVQGFAEPGLWKLEVAYDQPIPQAIYRVQCMEALLSSLGVRDGLPIMLPDDPCDDTQNWLKDTRYNYKLDKDGVPGFALINKRTKDLLVHYKTGTRHHVLLVPFEPNKLQDGSWWTESPSKVNGFYNIRCLDYNNMVFTIHRRGKPDVDGIPLILTNEKNSKETLWKITQRD